MSVFLGTVLTLPLRSTCLIPEHDHEVEHFTTASLSASFSPLFFPNESFRPISPSCQLKVIALTLDTDKQSPSSSPSHPATACKPWPPSDPHPKRTLYLDHQQFPPSESGTGSRYLASDQEASEADSGVRGCIQVHESAPRQRR